MRFVIINLLAIVAVIVTLVGLLLSVVTLGVIHPWPAVVPILKLIAKIGGVEEHVKDILE